MMDQIHPLAVTPKHHHDESMMGFLLRSSEMNDYRSPFILLAYTGLSESQARNIRPPIENVAQLYGRKSEALAIMDNNIPGNTTGSKEWSLMGQAVPSIYINAKTARICPECILENGYISQFWYLRHAVACPLHARIAINTCPDCGRELSWCRPGLLTCACGHDLSKGRGGRFRIHPCLLC